MKKIIVLLSINILFLATIFAKSTTNNQILNVIKSKKPALMWFDAEANFKRFSNPDSISYYLTKIKSLGFTHAVVDVRPITGEVLFDSEYAPKMKDWQGYKRENFDYLEHFIKKGHELGLQVHASLNIFVGGHNHFNRGQVYAKHPEWASMLYTPKEGIVSIVTQKKKYSAMINPINKDFQNHILNVLKELVTKYPNLDGLMLDRVRYDGIQADFSDISKKMFEKYLGKKIKRFPEDIYQWEEKLDGKYKIKRGKYFLKWLEWRTKNITDFMKKMRKEVKSVNKNIVFGTYTGAWYPSYYEVGVNFASKEYDPSKDFDWATPEYKKYGYAEVIDLYTTGNYYTDITIKESIKNNKSIQNETDSKSQKGTWYSVEGSCQKLKNILKKNKFLGGILVSQFYNNPLKLSETIEMNIKKSDGLMVFDIVHIIDKNLWEEVEAGMIAGGLLPSKKNSKPKLMWLDCSANFERFSYPNSIRYYVNKCKKAGITTLVLDIKDNSGEVLYPSKYAMQKKDWKGFKRSDFDFINTFINAARKNKLEIFVALNVFSDGQGIFKRGYIYNKHKKWQSINYVPGKGLVPITEIPNKGSLFLNPALKAVQDYQLNIIKEVIESYPFDGIILDRARYDGIQSDFSLESKQMFEKYIGKKINRFPQDIYEWKPNDKGTFNRIEGPHYKKWIEWRSSVIYNFMKDARKIVKNANPNCKFGAYTGAWYPSYFEVGVNWASNTYDVSKDFHWATSHYKNYGFAELLDFYTNGNYYKNITLDEYRNSLGVYKNETDSELSSGEHLCVEGACKYSKHLLKGAVAVCGGIYVQDYIDDANQFKRAIKMNLKESDGLMIFDIVHIIQKNWWNELKNAIDASSAYE